MKESRHQRTKRSHVVPFKSHRWLTTIIVIVRETKLLFFFREPNIFLLFSFLLFQRGFSKIKRSESSSLMTAQPVTRKDQACFAFTDGTRSVIVLKEQLDVDFVASTCRRCVSFRSSFLMHIFVQVHRAKGNCQTLIGRSFHEAQRMDSMKWVLHISNHGSENRDYVNNHASPLITMSNEPSREQNCPNHRRTIFPSIFRSRESRYVFSTLELSGK